MGGLFHFLRLFESLLSCEIGILIFEISRPTPPNAAAPVPFWARRRWFTENGPACITGISTVDKQLTPPILDHTHPVHHAETTVNVAKESLSDKFLVTLIFTEHPSS